MEMVLNYRRKDAFDLLGVDPDGFGRDVKEKYLEFAETFAPWTYPDEVADDARRVFLAGARAFGELSDPDRRQALANRRQGRAARRGSVDTFRIETDLLDPDVQFRKGRALMAEGNYRDAIEQLSYASDLDPQNGQYRAELAHCRYRFNPQAGGSIAIAELKEALRIDPGAGLAHFYQGEILAEMGMVDEAREALRRAIKPMAPDRRPIEALKRLQRSS
jgi:tetratricopeptide (TPR) repeat protein